MSTAECQVPGCQKNYKRRLNLVWHRMFYSCTHMATMGVKELKWQNYSYIKCNLWMCISILFSVWWMMKCRSMRRSRRPVAAAVAVVLVRQLLLVDRRRWLSLQLIPRQVLTILSPSYHLYCDGASEMKMLWLWLYACLFSWTSWKCSRRHHTVVRGAFMVIISGKHH